MAIYAIDIGGSSPFCALVYPHMTTVKTVVNPDVFNLRKTYNFREPYKENP